MVDAQEPRAFVTGWPIHHSRSPLIHNYWLREHNLSGSYKRVPVEPENFGDFLRKLSEAGYRGGNITLPHKEAAFELAGHVDDEARAIGAVNTVWLQDGELRGSNTDAYGFLANLDAQVPGWDSRVARDRGALIIGAGGAARAIVYALQQRDFARILIANRSEDRALKLATHFGRSCEAIALSHLSDEAYRCAILVNTSSVGMANERLPLAIDRLSDECVVTDIVYTPLTTPLLADAAARELRVVDGLGMLLHQAVPGFERWFGVRPAVTGELRQLVLADLGERS